MKIVVCLKSYRAEIKHTPGGDYLMVWRAPHWERAREGDVMKDGILVPGPAKKRGGLIPHPDLKFWKVIKQFETSRLFEGADITIDGVYVSRRKLTAAVNERAEAEKLEIERPWSKEKIQAMKASW